MHQLVCLEEGSLPVRLIVKAQPLPVRLVVQARSLTVCLVQARSLPVRLQPYSVLLHDTFIVQFIFAAIIRGGPAIEFLAVAGCLDGLSKQHAHSSKRCAHFKKSFLLHLAESNFVATVLSCGPRYLFHTLVAYKQTLTLDLCLSSITFKMEDI